MIYPFYMCFYLDAVDDTIVLQKGAFFTCFDWRLRLYPNPRYMGESVFLVSVLHFKGILYIYGYGHLYGALPGYNYFFLFLANRDNSIVSTYMVSHGIAFIRITCIISNYYCRVHEQSACSWQTVSGESD
jgi:hypothetical protein